MDKKETAQYAHQRVLDFTFTCDNKASFLLAFVGVVLTFVTTSNQFSTTISAIVLSVKEYWLEDQNMVLDFGMLVTGISVLAFYALFAVALYFLLASLTANIDPDGQDSVLFFGTIARKDKTIDKYLEQVNLLSETQMDDDLLKQTFRCSQICLKKYKNYGTAVCCVKWGVGVMLLFIVLSYLLF